MTVSNASYLKTFYDKTIAQGAKVISSDFTLEIEGFEHVYLMCKQAPWPELSSQGEIEISTPLGSSYAQPQQIRVYGQGPLTLYENVAGDADNLLLSLIAQSGAYQGNRGTFNCKIYEGTPDKYLRYKRLIDCFAVFDTIDRDWENRTQPLLLSGTLHYHYFGEVVEGNSTDYS